MKNKKLLLPVIILVVAILAIAAYSVCSSIARKPAVTEGEFPFTITYELDGKEVTIDEVYKVNYVENGGYADTKSRIYEGVIGNREKDDTVYILKEENNTRIELYTAFFPDYMMGDPEYDYFEDDTFEPKFYYYDAEEQEYSDEETLAAHGVKLISFKYPTPIKNSFVFSHISYFSGAVVMPTLLIALLALIATAVFVKKEKELKYKTIDTVSIVLSCISGVTIVPFVSIAAMFIDINGGGPEFSRQVFYFFPAFIVLCITAALALRRNGHAMKALVSSIVGPAVFIIFLIIAAAMGLL